MVRELREEVRQLKKENERLWEMIETLKKTNNRLLDVYIPTSNKQRGT